MEEKTEEVKVPKKRGRKKGVPRNPKDVFTPNDSSTNHDRKLARILSEPAAPELINPNKSELSATDIKKIRIRNHGLKLVHLPTVDLNDYEAVKKRIDDYLSICADDGITPTLEDFAVSMNLVSRQMIFRYANGDVNLKPEVRELFVGIRNYLASQLTSAMLEGTVKEISGIFLLKNNHHYVDRQDHVVAPANPYGDQQSAEDIAAKYSDIVIDEIPEKTGEGDSEE